MFRGLILSSIIAVVSWQPTQGQNERCSFSIWEDQTIVSDGTFGGNFGKLAEIYGAKSIDDCAFHCTLYRYCYTALYKRYRNSKSCSLYYYNFPPEYLYEVHSPIRIQKRTKDDDESGIIFGTSNCDTMALYKSPCQYTVQEKHDAVGFAPKSEKPDSRKVVNAEACAISCGQTDSCQAAVFIPAQPMVHSIDVLSSCHHHISLVVAQVEARSYSNSHEDKAPAVVVHGMSCLRARSFSCTYTNSTLMFKGQKTRPDTHYGASNADECAFICGHHPLCLSAVFDTRRSNCFIHRETNEERHRFEERKGRLSDSIHLAEISCRGSKRSPDLANFKPVAGELGRGFWQTGKPRPLQPEQPLRRPTAVNAGISTGSGAFIAPVG